MKNNLKYSVRIIDDSIELTKCFALRFKIYSKTFPEAIKDKQTKYESDHFDCRSIHIGLYCENPDEKNLVGYCRFIIPNKLVNQFEDCIIPNHDKYPSPNEISRNDELHFAYDLQNSYKLLVSKFCNQLKDEEKLYIETSRFIIDEEHRSLTVLSFFTTGMMALAQNMNISYAFFSCSIHHAPYYKRAGLTLFPGLEIYENQRFGSNFILFGTDLASFYQNSFNIVKRRKASQHPDIMTELRKVA